MQHQRDAERVVELGEALEVDMGLAFVGAVLGADGNRQRVDASRTYQLLSGGNLGPGVSWSEADGKTQVLLVGANVAF